MDECCLYRSTIDAGFTQPDVKLTSPLWCYTQVDAAAQTASHARCKDYLGFVWGFCYNEPWKRFEAWDKSTKVMGKTECKENIGSLCPQKCKVLEDWCKLGKYSKVDCDYDGMPDHVCVQPDKTVFAASSTKDCRENELEEDAECLKLGLKATNFGNASQPTHHTAMSVGSRAATSQLASFRKLPYVVATVTAKGVAHLPHARSASVLATLSGSVEKRVNACAAKQNYHEAFVVKLSTMEKYAMTQNPT
jgi:hypothetical protein